MNIVYVVTPCMNAVETIDRTILSVISQAGDVKIRYHVQDGGSTDGTIERLEEWKQRLRNGSVPRQCHGIRFSYTSEPDTGMYDALLKGFTAVDAHADSFMTWINADDILMPGSLAMASALGRQFTSAQLSWFGGAVCILRDDMISVSYDRPIPTPALREGICDGAHWDYLQQEGTFFRKWLWAAVNPRHTIATMKLAGDWNLWRLMAAKAGFAQVTFPLGGFRITEGQLSASQRGKYLGEINGLVPGEARRAAFEKLCAAAPVQRRRIKALRGSTFMIYEETVDAFARHRHQAVFGSAAPWAKRKALPEKTLAEGQTISHARVDTRGPEFPDIAPLVLRKPGLIALDADWQFPAITEQHAFRRMQEGSRLSPKGALYVAYPWATLIDKLQNKAKDRDLHLDRFEQFCALLPAGVPKVTVCQHIHARRYLDLFRQAGIADVFWSHATPEDAAATTDAVDLRLHPFPLYPVQVVEALPEAGADADGVARPHLFSFIGARANQYYITQARNWILDFLAEDSRGLVIGRDGWHYQKVVYDHQVYGKAKEGDTATLVDRSASDEFRDSLLNSTFSLCPGGSGPNSIRLWESIGAGAIPVILADSWAPPGDRRLWDLAAVFCTETPEDVKALPDRLAAIAADPARLAQMRHAMRQIWILYGPQGFVSDVQERLLAHAGDLTSVAEGEEADLLDVIVGQDGALEEMLLLRSCASALLLRPEITLRRLAGDTPLGRAVTQARAALDPDSPLGAHFDAVLAHATRQAGPVAPMLLRGAVPAVCLLGRHSHRTPLSYAPIRSLIGDKLDWTADPAAADVILTGFNIDLRENAATLRPLLEKAGAPKIVVMSEEPLWDITWSGPFTGRAGKLVAEGTEIPYCFLGHETSDIYAFDRLPYFVLTSDVYAVRYAALMAGFGKLDARGLLDLWAKAPVRAAFFAENRKGEAYAKAFPERDVASLSAYRTEIAERSEGAGVLRVGKGWGAEVRRQDLPDWHLDKLAQLKGRARIVSSYENVHQHAYISEKIFDAFAVGAIPTYWASPKHRIFDLVPEAAMLNTHGLDAAAAAARIADFTPDMAFAEAWLAACIGLGGLFEDFGAIEAERLRVARAALKEVLSVV